MATYTSYDEVGAKEDVSDIITNISPTKTPFLSSLKTEKIHQRVHQWQEDSLDAVATNAQVEGFDAVDPTLTPTVLRQNNTQILSKNVKVSGSADSTLAYGRAKESAYQMGKQAAAAKRDLENALVGANQAAVVGSDGVARKMASAFALIDASTTVAGGTAALNETMVLTAMQDLYTSGGDASIIQIKPSDSLIVANFATATGRSRQYVNDATKVTNVVKVYASPFGDVKIVMNRFQLATTALVYDPEYWRLLVFRNWFREQLAKTGDNTKMMLVGEFSLKHKNFKASAFINAIT